MQIIIMHSRFTSAKSITLTSAHLLLALLGFVLFSILCAAGMAALTLRMANSEVPFFKTVIAPLVSGDAAGEVFGEHAVDDKYVKANLAAMAIKLGEMQAQLMRLDALGERVQGLAGVKPEEFNFYWGV